MKNIFTILGLLVLSLTASAQAGSWYLGGTAGFINSSTKENNNFVYNSWNFSPEVGTFLKDDIQLGVGLNLSRSSSKDDDMDFWKSSNFSPVVYLRKFWSMNDQLSLFVGLDLQYISGSSKNYQDIDGNIEESINTISGFGANLNGGVFYSLSERIAVVGKYGLLGWQSTKYVADPDDASQDVKTTEFTFGINSLGPVFNIGIYWTMIPAGS